MPSYSDFKTTAIATPYWNFGGPQLSFTAGGGTGAVVYALVTEGVITSYVITSGGSGYANGPFAVAVSPSLGGVSITATASGGVINALSISSGGSGYNIGNGAPAWKLNFPANVWDTLMDSLANWRQNINGNTMTLSNLGNLSFASGAGFAGGWTNASLVNSWANTGGGFNFARYRLEVDCVRLSGNINAGSNNTVAFILPVGYRPANGVNLVCWNSGGNDTTFIMISTNGNVEVSSFGTIGNISLEGLTFPLT